MYDQKLHFTDDCWQEIGFAGIQIKPIHKDDDTGELIVLTRMAAGAVIPRHSHTHADEFVLVLEGEFFEDGEMFGPLSTFFGKAGNVHGPHKSESGCLLMTRFSATLDFVLRE